MGDRKLIKHVCGKLSLLHPGANRLRASGDGSKVIGFQRLHLCPDGRLLLQRREKSLESLSSDHEARRHCNPGTLQLTEAPALTTHMGPVAEPDVGKPTDVS